MIGETSAYLITLSDVHKIAAYVGRIGPNQKVDARPTRLVPLHEVRQNSPTGNQRSHRRYTQLCGDNARRSTIHQVKFQRSAALAIRAGHSTSSKRNIVVLF